MSDPLTEKERAKVENLRGWAKAHQLGPDDSANVELAIIDRLCDRITALSGKTQFCADCEARQRRIEKLGRVVEEAAVVFNGICDVGQSAPGADLSEALSALTVGAERFYRSRKEIGCIDIARQTKDAK